MKITTIGLDRKCLRHYLWTFAKNVFQIHGADERGAAVLCKQLKRDQVAPFFACLDPCLIGIEACGGAHYWATKLSALGHRVKTSPNVSGTTSLASPGLEFDRMNFPSLS